MDVRMAHMSWDEVQACIDESRMVIVPTGATEAHGAHMPTDTDTHQADHMAAELAGRVGAVVAPALPYAVSKTFEHFVGTVPHWSEGHQLDAPRFTCFALIKSFESDIAKCSSS